jgi:hypothetical protein
VVGRGSVTESRTYGFGALARCACITRLREGSAAQGRIEYDGRVDEAVGLIMNSQECLDWLSQGQIGPAFAVDDGRSGALVLLFDGREEHSLDAPEIDWHGILLQQRYCST